MKWIYVHPTFFGNRWVEHHRFAYSVEHFIEPSQEHTPYLLHSREFKCRPRYQKIATHKQDERNQPCMSSAPGNFRLPRIIEHDQMPKIPVQYASSSLQSIHHFLPETNGHLTARKLVPYAPFVHRTCASWLGLSFRKSNHGIKGTRRQLVW